MTSVPQIAHKRKKFKITRKTNIFNQQDIATILVDTRFYLIRALFPCQPVLRGG